ncbi:unnamed protein product, partial [marine sediment metagenome]
VPAIRNHEDVCEASYDPHYYEQEDLGDNQSYSYRYSRRGLKRFQEGGEVET